MVIPQRAPLTAGRGWHHWTLPLRCDDRGGNHGVAAVAATRTAVRNRAAPDTRRGIDFAGVGLSQAVLVRSRDCRRPSGAATPVSARRRARVERSFGATEAGGGAPAGRTPVETPQGCEDRPQVGPHRCPLRVCQTESDLFGGDLLEVITLRIVRGGEQGVLADKLDGCWVGHA